MSHPSRDSFQGTFFLTLRYMCDINKLEAISMKVIDLRKPLSSYSKGWVAINKKNKKVVAHAETFALISKKIKDTKDIFLVPASKDYFGFVTSLNA